MHIFMYSLAHCGISGFKMYGTSHLKCSSSCVWAIKQQWGGESRSVKSELTRALASDRPAEALTHFGWYACVVFDRYAWGCLVCTKKARKKRGWEWLYSNYSIHTGEKNDFKLQRIAQRSVNLSVNSCLRTKSYLVITYKTSIDYSKK